MSFPVPLMVLVLAQVILGSIIVLVGFPAIIFPRLDVDEPDQWMARTGLMLAWVMIAGYLLAVMRLFSGVALLVLMALTAWVLRRQVRSRYELSNGAHVSASLYDIFSQTFNLRRKAADQAESLSQRLTRGFLPRRPGPYVWTALTLGVLGVAAWMRIEPNWAHAGMFFSDAYETVQWVKGIDASQLFPTGIYPMGYYIVMAVVKTLTHANAVMFVKFFGGFVGMLLTASVMWSTYRFSGRAVPALVAGAVYGLLPHLMPYTGTRQLAAEGQEFGNMLVLPVTWLVFQSWVTKKPGYVLAASATLAAVGLTHPIAVMNAALGAIAGTIGGWVVSGAAGRVLKQYLWMVPVATVVSVAPLAIAYAMGIPLLSTGISFINKTGIAATTATGGGSGAHIVYPSVSLMVWVALAGIFILFVTKLLWYDELWEMGLPAAAVLLLGFAEGIVQLPRIGINTAALVTRAGAFLALVEALGIGLGVAGLQEAVERLGVRRSLAAGGTLAAAVIGIGYFFKQMPPKPFLWYTMSPDDFVVQYVRIEKSLPRYSWVSVAYDSFALAVNEGYQYNPNFWMAHVSPTTRWPKFHGFSSKPYAVSQRYIFLFQYHHIYHSELIPGLMPLYSQTVQQNRLTTRWIKEWERRFGPMPVYYHSRDLTVYELTNSSNPSY